MTTWKATVQIGKLHRLILSVVLRVELLLQCFWTLPLHGVLAVCSHSRGISSSFQLSGWKQASAPTVARRTLNPQLSAHFQLAGKKLILTRTGPPGPHWANLRYAWLPPCPESSTLPFTFSASVCARLLCWASQALRGEHLKDTTICFSREIDETAATLRFLAAVRTCRVDGPGQAPVLSHTGQGYC